MLGFQPKSSRHTAVPLPVFEGVPGHDPPPAEADGRDDSLLQHHVHRHAADVQATRDLIDRHPCAVIHSQPIVFSAPRTFAGQ